MNSYDEWSKLKEIIVGSAKNYTSHDRELSFDIFHHENLYRSDWAYPRLRKSSKLKAKNRAWQINQKYVEELHEDVENFASVLSSFGIRVHRPIELPTDVSSINGFGWEALPVPALNIRDNTLILGNEIIETPPAMRSRYLETRLLGKVFQKYFEAGAKWTTMPRPILTDRSFDLSYARATETTLGGPTETIEKTESSPFDVGFEMMLDGAQVLRLGKDLIVNIANENHSLACNWLERHVGEQFRIHRVDRLSDNHIDSMIVALRPGVFLARHSQVREKMPTPFQNWKYIIPPPPAKSNFPTYDDEDLILTTPYIDLNVLSIDTESVVVNSDCPDVFRCLEREHFTVVPVKHRHRRLFGGGFHCFTLDTVRTGSKHDYTN